MERMKAGEFPSVRRLDGTPQPAYDASVASISLTLERSQLCRPSRSNLSNLSRPQSKT
jgi:hypothetical protein